MPPSLHGRVQTEEETGSLLPPSGFLGSTPFKPFKPYHSPSQVWVNPLQTLQSPFFPSKSFPRLRSTPVSHPIWIMFWGVAQNKKNLDLKLKAIIVFFGIPFRIISKKKSSFGLYLWWVYFSEQGETLAITNLTMCVFLEWEHPRLYKKSMQADI